MIQAEGGPVKIGIAIDPQKRLLALRTGTPFPLRLAHVETIDATLRASAVERAAHALLSAAHAHGEWFNISVDEAQAAVQQAVQDMRSREHVRTETKSRRSDDIVIILTTGNQLKAARALAGVEQIGLAEASGLSVGTIRNMEARGADILKSSLDTIASVQRVLEAHGIEFLNHGSPGVRLRKAPAAQAEGQN